MAPTNAEIIWMVALCVIGWGFLIYAFLRKDYVTKYNDDPYRYCPKEEEY